MILAIIPARAGSERIKNKNIYPLLGKPLIQYTIDAVLNSKIDDYRITTDIKSLLGQSKVRLRPENLCGSEVEAFPVIRHAVHEYEKANKIRVDTVMVLQPTSPLRTGADINNAIDFYNEKKATSLYSGSIIPIKHKNIKYIKQWEKHFQRNGAIFMTDRMVLQHGTLWNADAVDFVMPCYKSIDIDTMEDMIHAELILKGLLSGGNV